jgi:hypothetical protein
MDYYNGLMARPETFKSLEKKEYQISAISAENIGTLLKKENLDEYRAFFNAKYLGIKQ